MCEFSAYSDYEENIGELVLEILLSSNIDSITDLSLSYNLSWFKNPITKEERSGNVDLLVELISKQARLHRISLAGDDFHSIAFSSNATLAVLTRI